jgi:ABC-type Zn uptake system ZnuABC Zn-binding protein ZnuA
MNKIFRAFALFLCCSTAYCQIVIMSCVPALGLLVKQIGDQHVTVKNLFEQPTDPHFFQLTPQQLVSLHQSDLTIVAQEFVEKIPLSTDRIISIYHINEQTPVYIHALQHLQKGTEQHHEHAHDHADHKDCDCHDHKHQEHEHHQSSIKHEWLSFNGAIALTEVIVEKLSHLDPQHAQIFKENAQKVYAELKALKVKYRHQPFLKQHLFYHDSFQNLAIDLDQNFGPALYRCEESTISAHELARIISQQDHYSNLIIETTTHSHSLERLTDKIKLPIVKIDTLGYGNYQSHTSFIDLILKEIYQ